MVSWGRGQVTSPCCLTCPPPPPTSHIASLHVVSMWISWQRSQAFYMKGQDSPKCHSTSQGLAGHWASITSTTFRWVSDYGPAQTHGKGNKFPSFLKLKKIFYLFIFCLSRATLMAYGSSQARG